MDRRIWVYYAPDDDDFLPAQEGMTVELFDVVTLLDDLPQQGLAKGTVGTIVHVFDQPRRAYEVEFVSDDGVTIATATLLPEQVRSA